MLVPRVIFIGQRNTVVTSMSCRTYRLLMKSSLRAVSMPFTSYFLLLCFSGFCLLVLLLLDRATKHVPEGTCSTN